MNTITFEHSDLMNRPIECFYIESSDDIFPVKPHYHYYMEILFVKQGCANILCKNESYTVNEGELILFHPNAVHSISNLNDCDLKCYGFKLDINQMTQTSAYSPKLRSIFKSIEQKNMDIHFPKEFVESNHLSDIFIYCRKEIMEQPYGYDIIIRSQIYTLLLLLLRYYMENGYSIDSEVYTEDSRYDVLNITDYIASNIGNRIKISDIAEKCGMSYSYFAKKFQAIYKKTCKEYIEELQVCHAEELLIFTDFDLTYIAQECGYSDCSHLINNFKKYRGLTPKKFRLQHLKNIEKSAT